MCAMCANLCVQCVVCTCVKLLGHSREPNFCASHFLYICCTIILVYWTQKPCYLVPTYLYIILVIVSACHSLIDDVGFGTHCKLNNFQNWESLLAQVSMFKATCKPREFRVHEISKPLFIFICLKNYL